MALTVDGLNSWLTLAGGVIVVGGGVYAGWRFVRPALREAGELMGGLRLVVKEFPGVAVKVEKLNKDFTPNGGSSVIDTINKNSVRLADIGQQQGQQTSMLHSVMELFPDSVVWTDKDGDPTAVSRGFTAMTGLDLQGMQRGGWRRMVASRDIETVDRKWGYAVKHREIFSHEYSIHNVLKPEQGEFRVKALAMPLPGEAGWKAVFTKPDDDIRNAPPPAMATNTPLTESLTQ